MTSHQYGIESPGEAARVAARLADLFDQCPEVERAVATRITRYASSEPAIRVAPFRGQDMPGEVIGIYDRTVTLAQLIEDCDA